MHPLRLPRSHRSQARRRHVVASLAVVLLVGGCGADPDPAPDAAIETDVPRSVVVPAAVDASMVARIGHGRAVAAASEAGTTVVATTLGLHVARGDDWTELPVAAVAETDLLALDPEGTVAFARRAGSTEMWSLTPEPALVDALDDVTAVGFAADGGAVVVTPDRVAVLDLPGGIPASDTPAPAASVFGELAVAPDRSWWAVTTTDPNGVGLLLAVDGHDPQWRALPLDPGTVVHRAVADPSGRRVVLGVSDGADIFSGRIVAIDLTGDEIAWSAEIGEAATDRMWAVGPDGRVLVLDGSAARLLTPDDPSGRDLPPLDGNPGAVWATSAGFAVLLRDGTTVGVDSAGRADVVASGTGRALGFSTTSEGATAILTIDGMGAIEQRGADGTLVRHIDDFVAGYVNGVAFGPDGRVALATSTGVVHVTSGPEAGAPVTDLVNPEGNVDAVAFSPDGERLLVGVGERRGDTAFDDSVAMWDLEEGRRLWSTGGEAEDVIGCSSFGNVVRFAPDGSFVVGLSHDYVVSLADPGSGEMIHAFPAHLGRVWDAALSADGGRLATSAEDSTLRIWDTASRSLLTEVPQLGGFRSLAFLPDGSGLVVSDIQGRVAVLDPTDGEVRTTFEAQVSPNAHLTLSPDGRILAGGDEETVRIWSTETGAVLAELHAHTGLVETVAFSADGARLVSGASDGTAVVWDLTVI